MADDDRQSPRLVEVDGDRLDRWAATFAERHGPSRAHCGDAAVELLGSDGARAVLNPLAPNPGWARSLATWAAYPPVVAVVLVRRGGYAVGLAQGGAFLAHKTGSRYVQSRTAAGGWSQQRFARRRENQADTLVAAVAEHTARVLDSGSSQAASPVEALICGGDRGLVQRALSDARLASMAAWPRRELFDLPDPTFQVLGRALRRGRAVRVTLWEP